ncbi:hypothetical protein HMPREF0290_1785 [Corynebacterium efficiens YS-314]|uniref:Uncharacterized protein n=1 Tax=Corynebacterium efficiens (strain DSM 44549 / YS-314 / AJ 12310 / JCM 11189 / NBRC 100395) TaxID=196164 RepID=Q8FT20_COREF|nr:hypothetical protein HMPREF0290_1785 [Corynebacterium efficiens YS-314]BAC18561.1 hypothetical protein [Corynebacterium efficiens YS-314]
MRDTNTSGSPGHARYVKTGRDMGDTSSGMDITRLRLMVQITMDHVGDLHNLTPGIGQ